MTRLFMTVGTRDGVKVGDLMGAIAGEGGIPGDHVGKIDLRENHALVEVSEGDAASVIARVNGAMIRGRRVVVRGERDREERDRSAGPRGDRFATQWRIVVTMEHSPRLRRTKPQAGACSPNLRQLGPHRLCSS